MEKIIAAWPGDDTIIRLRAELTNKVVELADKDLLLRTYESLFTVNLLRQLNLVGLHWG